MLKPRTSERPARRDFMTSFLTGWRLASKPEGEQISRLTLAFSLVRDRPRQSGRGLPHSKTLARIREAFGVRQSSAAFRLSMRMAEAKDVKRTARPRYSRLTIGVTS